MYHRYMYLISLYITLFLCIIFLSNPSLYCLIFVNFFVYYLISLYIILFFCSAGAGISFYAYLFLHRWKPQKMTPVSNYVPSEAIQCRGGGKKADIVSNIFFQILLLLVKVLMICNVAVPFCCRLVRTDHINLSTNSCTILSQISSPQKTSNFRKIFVFRCKDTEWFLFWKPKFM